MRSYTILVLADMHVGSKLAVLHPQTPGYILHNDAQRYLWQCWQHMLSKLPRKIDIVVSMDELIDGPANSRKKKYGTLITRLEGQRRAVKKLLKPVLNKAEKLYCLIGSEYHTDEWGEASRTLAQYLGADPVFTDGNNDGDDGEGDSGDGSEYACYNLFLQFGDVILDFAHHASATMVNRLMVLERETRYRKIDNPIPKNVDGEIRGIIRAHSHVFGVTQDRHCLSIRCPGWQFPYYDYGIAKASVARSYPDIGWILLEVIPEQAHWPVRIKDFCLYDYPKAQVIQIA